MKFNEFKEKIKNEASFSIRNRHDEINLDNYLPVKKAYKFRFNFVALFSSFVILLALGVFSYFFFTPQSFLAMEFNPSLTLKLNAFNQVIDIEDYNEDGLALYEDLNLKYKSIAKVNDLIYEYAEEQGLLEDEGLYVLYGIESKSDSNLTKLKTLIINNLNDNVFAIVVNVDLINQDYLAPNDIPESSSNIEGSIDNSSSLDQIERTDYIEYQVSDLKFALALEIFANSSEYTTEADFIYLLELDIKDLYDIYNQE
ncbi:MAG: hypothetical protein RBR66_03410 [Candidatus Izemoplasmatales bacterium]|jgi:hypothetical protein|nr:hypothetical protein [Candidatus Izemoplasmatales bacterium]